MPGCGGIATARRYRRLSRMKKRLLLILALVGRGDCDRRLRQRRNRPICSAAATATSILISPEAPAFRTSPARFRSAPTPRTTMATASPTSPTPAARARPTRARRTRPPHPAARRPRPAARRRPAPRLRAPARRPRASPAARRRRRRRRAARAAAAAAAGGGGGGNGSGGTDAGGNGGPRGDHPPRHPQPRRHPDRRQPGPQHRRLRRLADRRPELHDRPVRDPAVPAADLPGLRNPVRDPMGGPGLDQQDRVGVRDQHGPVHRGRRRLDAVPAVDLEGLRGRRQRRRREGPLQPRRRDLRRGAATSTPPAATRTCARGSSPTTTPTGTSTRSCSGRSSTASCPRA